MIKIGIVGMGEHIGIAKSHIKAYISHRETDVVALYDIDQNQCKKYKQEFNLKSANIYTDLNTLLDNVDAISICTPNDTHTIIANKAIAKGVHVLCEKPFSTSCDPIEELIENTNKTSLINMVGFCYRGLPCYKYIKNQIDKDFFGQIYYVKMSLGGGRISNENVKREWRMDAKKSGAGALSDFGSHLFDMVDYLLSDKIGKIKQLQVQRETYITHRASETLNEIENVDNDDVAIFTAKSENNTLINLIASRVGAAHELEIYGQKGYMSFNINNKDKINVVEKLPTEGLSTDSKMINIPKKYFLINGEKTSNLFEVGFYEEIDTFVKSIKSGKNNDRDFSRGLYIQYLLDKSLLSAQTNELVTIDRRN